MKKLIAITLALLMLLAGCASPAPVTENPTTTPAATPTEPGRVCMVSTVDELLDAIAPDTEIILAPGTYTLSEAADYAHSDSEFYSWDDCGDGFELRLFGVKNLIIRGSGKGETSLETLPRNAFLLDIMACTNVQLFDLTLGHAIAEPYTCMGGVLRLQDSKDVSVTDCGLFGCGTIGLVADYSDNITVTGTDIYHCSMGGVTLADCRNVTLDGCSLYDLGYTDVSAYNALEFRDSKNITVKNSTLRDNNNYQLVNVNNCVNVSLASNKLDGNKFESSVFNILNSDVTLDSNTVTGCQVRSWYPTGTHFALDASGTELTNDDLFALYPETVIARPAPSENVTEVHASTVDELLAAIGSDTTIYIDEKMYDLSTASDYGQLSNNPYYDWIDNFDGPALYIKGVDNLTICSTDGIAQNHTVAAIPRYADIFCFQNCTNIKLYGFTAGHTKEPGSCIGGVLRYQNTDGIIVEQCGLFGCGVLGINAEYCSDIQVIDTEIYECEWGGVSMMECHGVSFDRCIFRDLGGSKMSFNGCTDITEDGQPLNGSGYYD